MGRATAGVRGMNVSQKGNGVLAMDVARADQDLLVVTENGYGKRTAIDEYPIKGRGTMGVKTIALTDRKGALAGALVVREHEELVFISTNGMVQRTGVRGINRYGRASQGVKVMNMKDDDTVSAVALVMESERRTDGEPVADEARRMARRRRRRDGSRAATAPTPDAGRDAPSRRVRTPASRWPASVAATARRQRRPRVRLTRWYLLLTRERRWSVSVVTCFAGPWRWPAASSRQAGAA